MCAKYSSRKYLKVDTTGFCADCPNPQRDIVLISSLICSNTSRSSSLPSPCVILIRMSSIRVVPTLHGGHFPQDSFAQKARKNLPISTIHVVSSTTTRLPDHIIAPASSNDSKSMGLSRSDSGKQPPEGPPICTALNFFFFGIPPPISKTISLMVIPIGTSIKPVFLTFPVSAKIFVPLLFSVPIFEYHFAPLLMMMGTLANVSTLFKQVGLSHKPASTDCGGLVLGMPRLPSMEYCNAVDSPHTKAPAPSFMTISRL